MMAVKERLERGILTRAESAELLEECAKLIEEGRRPSLDGKHLVAVLKALTGKDLSEFESEVTIEIVPSQRRLLRSVPLARGIQLHVTEDLRLAKLTIAPQKLRERERLMAFVGIGVDSQRDVARRHDFYLPDAYMNARKSDQPG